MKLADAAAHAATLENHWRAGTLKPKRGFPDRAVIDAKRAIVPMTSNARRRIHLGHSHSNHARIGKGQECAAGANVGALQSVAHHAGSLVRIDRGRSRAGAMRGIERKDAMRGADFNAVPTAQTGLVKTRLIDGARRAKQIERDRRRESLREQIGQWLDEPPRGVKKKIASMKTGHRQRMVSSRESTTKKLQSVSDSDSEGTDAHGHGVGPGNGKATPLNASTTNEISEKFAF